MFSVKPVKDKEYQKQICAALGTPYIENTMAFVAADMCGDLESVDIFIGICQFTVGKTGEIVTLFPAEGREHDEAMIVLCRTVMSFMNRLGIHEMTMAPDAGPEAMLAGTGIPKLSGVYTVDLDEFYKEPCRYGKNNNAD